MSNSTGTRNTKPLNHIGDQITVTIGRITITLQWVREGAYTVTTYQGGTLRIEEHCKSWPTEDHARGHAYMVAEFYNNNPANYVWPCGCRDTGWIGLGNDTFAPCGGCNKDGARPLI